jgi:hypothetical protein
MTAVKKAVAAEDVASMLRPYLENVCGDVSDDEALIHSGLARNQFRVATPEEWLRKKQWLIRLKEANDRKSVYHQLIFRKNIMQKLFELCKANLWLGPWVVKQFASYEDAKTFGVSKELTNKLYVVAEEASRAIKQFTMKHGVECAPVMTMSSANEASAATA